MAYAGGPVNHRQNPAAAIRGREGSARFVRYGGAVIGPSRAEITRIFRLG
jgi:hypothetical protein